MKKILQFLFHRVVLVTLALALQIALLAGMILRFNRYFVVFYGVCILLSIVAVLWIISNKSNPGYKIAWIIPILLFPIFGGLFYMMFGSSLYTKKTKQKMKQMGRSMKQGLQQDPKIREELTACSLDAANQSRYITDYACCPVWTNTTSEYLPMGEIKFERMKEELRKAKHYIFLEYFIIQEGVMWNELVEILQQKVKEGVDVRLIYDDVGCIMTLPYHYERRLREMGIKCQVFNRFVPVLSTFLNNRDHRKICVIDGYVGFTGGINLADEYINVYEKHGHWKDSAVILKGDAVWNFTMMFLTMWEYVTGEKEDYEKYRPHQWHEESFEGEGFVQPYTDSPLDGEAVGETVYLNLINKAQRYVYITSPYLIIDNEMVTALSSAAKAGVDVRIITPHIADKAFVHATTRAYYESLLEAGVHIYEYTPGFIHAKTFVVDDEYCVVGTINMDYRSLYLHFECGAWMYRTPCVAQVRDDFFVTQNISQEITLEQCQKVPFIRRLARAVLRAFAPLM